MSRYMKWKVLESEYLFKQQWLTVRKEKCELPNGKIMKAYYTLEYPTWVNAFALTDDGRVLLVKQYRHGMGMVCTELPGGVVDDGEAPEVAIARELREETGYEFSSLEMMGKISANPATTNNYTYLYLAKGGKKVAEQQLDETEDVEVLVHSVDEVKKMLRDNQFIQSLHISCIFFALEKLGMMTY